MGEQLRQDILLTLTDPLPEDPRAAGFVRVPYSSNDSAYGFIPVPFAVAGPTGGLTILLLAGAHGDEAAAQIAATRLIAEADVATMNGRVIALPMANTPASAAATRNSPIDGLNLNRAYPGDMFGAPTEVIASYIETHLMPRCDLVIDLHSASRSLTYLSCATLIYHPDSAERARRLALAVAFGAPLILVFHSYEERTSAGAAKRAGAIRIGTEMSGTRAVGSMLEGLVRLLSRDSGSSDRPTPEIRVVSDQHYLFATVSGLFEPRLELGDEVRAGDIGGYIHDPSRPLSPAHPLTFGASGRVVCARPVGPTQTGDCLFHLAEPAGADLVEQAEEIVRSGPHHYLGRSARARAPARRRSSVRS